MTRPYQDNIVDEILSDMPLKEKVILAKMNRKEVEVLQGVYDLYLRSKVDHEDEEFDNIMNELWKKVRETHRLRIVR